MILVLNQLFHDPREFGVCRSYFSLPRVSPRYLNSMNYLCCIDEQHHLKFLITMFKKLAFSVKSQLNKD